MEFKFVFISIKGTSRVTMDIFFTAKIIFITYFKYLLSIKGASRVPKNEYFCENNWVEKIAYQTISAKQQADTCVTLHQTDLRHASTCKSTWAVPYRTSSPHKALWIMLIPQYIKQRLYEWCSWIHSEWLRVGENVALSWDPAF